jgi:hypothetical protein
VPTLSGERHWLAQGCEDAWWLAHFDEDFQLSAGELARRPWRGVRGKAIMVALTRTAQSGLSLWRRSQRDRGRPNPLTFLVVQ